jgi:hypothetical protein
MPSFFEIYSPESNMEHGDGQTHTHTICSVLFSLHTLVQELPEAKTLREVNVRCYTVSTVPVGNCQLAAGCYVLLGQPVIIQLNKTVSPVEPKGISYLHNPF